MEWISTKDKLPPRKHYVLGWIKDANCENNQMFAVIERTEDENLDHWFNDESLVVENKDILYWCELPKPPQSNNFYNL